MFDISDNNLMYCTLEFRNDSLRIRKKSHQTFISSLLNMFQMPLEGPSWKQLRFTFIHLFVSVRLTAVLVRTLTNTVFHKSFNILLMTTESAEPDKIVRKTIGI